MYLATVTEAARITGLSPVTIRRRIAGGDVPHMMVGGRIMVDADALREIVEAEAKCEMIGIAELSEITGLSSGAIRRAIREGWLTAANNGRKYVFRRENAISEIERRLRGGK